MAAVQAQTPLFDTFGPVNPDMIGQDRWWETQPLDGTDPPTGWTVRFTAGWGDCQAGCIDRHSWTWDVTTDGTVTFVSEEGSPLNDQLLAGLRRDAKGPGAGGRVTAGPTCPVERPNDPACAPTDGGGSRAARSRRRRRGSRQRDDRPERPLPVRARARRVHARAAVRRRAHGDRVPVTFVVTDGDVAWLDVAYDTGIR